MVPIYLHPTAGFIPDHGKDSKPAVALSASDKAYLQDLAKKVCDIALKPRQEAAEKLWLKHNALEKTRPLYIVYPELSWADLLPLSELRIEDPFWRNYEWYLKHLIYRDLFIDDDFVVKAEIFSFVDYRINNQDWGFPANINRIEHSGGWVVQAPVHDYGDIKNFRMPELIIDKASTGERHERIYDVFGGILTAKQSFFSNFIVNQPGDAARLRGIEQLMLDMYDAPDWLHELMELLTKGYIKLYKEMEATGLLTPNTENHYVDSGGMGITDELPKKDIGCRLADLWGFGLAQEFSEVSPLMHEEFGIRYQAQVLKLFGLNSYGCCEPFTNKFDIFKNIPRLRRVSVSSWCDREIAAEKLQDKVIYSWKPSPSFVLMEHDFDSVQRYVQETLYIAKDCALEIFLKDIIRLDENKHRIHEYCSFMREVCENRQ